jgi:OOP family OmpA-OmpF porin
VVLALILVGCSSSGAPEPEVTEPVVDSGPWGSDHAIEPAWPREQVVVLLENEDGTVGEVGVDSPEGSATLTEPRQAVSFSDPDETFHATADQVKEMLATVTAQPERPVQFTLYFDGATKLTEASQTDLEKIVSILKGRAAPEVSIAAHTDSIGSVDWNLKISQQRAILINEALLAGGMSPDQIDLSFHGETQLAVATGDGVDEAANRRVEIRIR